MQTTEMNKRLYKNDVFICNSNLWLYNDKEALDAATNLFK